MVISGQRVRQAREIQALTQQRLAARIGVSQAAIAQIEAGAFLASEELVAAIARCTHQPVGFFTQGSGPEFPCGSLLFRSHAALTSKERVSVCRYAEQVYELAVRLRKRTRPMPVKIPSLTALEPEEAARRMRQGLGLSEGEPVPHLLNLLEWSGVVVLSIPSGKTREAFSFWFEEFPILAIARDSPGDRGRSSVAHELGHLVLHAHKSRWEVEDTEADDFAAQFLLPEEALSQEIRPPVTLSSLAVLKAKWRVSMQALIRRAQELSIVTDRRYRYLFEQLSSMGGEPRSRLPSNRKSRGRCGKWRNESMEIRSISSAWLGNRTCTRKHCVS